MENEPTTPDYLTYKRSKIKTEIEEKRRPISKINFLLQLFLATFIVMFIIIVVVIMKFSSRVDIEYASTPSGDYSMKQEEENIPIAPNYAPFEDEQQKIDMRLRLIQQEENAPSEAKIISDSNKDNEIINPIHIEESKKIDKIEKIKTQNALSETKKPSETQETIKKTVVEINNTNQTISSKVLVGRFPTFEDAQRFLNGVKNDPRFDDYAPYVRKVGDVYSVQMGSFVDFPTAKARAQRLKARSLDVWIYQQ